LTFEFHFDSLLTYYRGGEEVLLDVGGQDATEAFEDVGHSDEAREILDGLLVGTLKRQVSPQTSLLPALLINVSRSPETLLLRFLKLPQQPQLQAATLVWELVSTLLFFSVEPLRLAHTSICKAKRERHKDEVNRTISCSFVPVDG
jgi:hypothetical protein